MSSEPSQPPCDTPSTSSPPENNPPVIVTKVTPLDPQYFRQFHYDEDILEDLTKPDFPWYTLHHRVLFPSQQAFTRPNQNPIYTFKNKYFLPSRHIDWFNNPIHSLDSFEEGNMANISPTTKIDISIKSGVLEEITIGAACSPEKFTTYKALFQEYRDIFSWSYTEMHGLDPSIVKHRINNWPDITPIYQKQCPLHPSKAVSIKAENEKLHTAGFIYPIAYTSWVSNPIPINKTKGTIHIYTNFCDLDHAYPKDNFPMPFIDQIIDDCTSHKALSFMDGFCGYNQIQIHPVD
jgi:hypothetical protein